MNEEDEDMMWAIESAKAKGSTKEHFIAQVRVSLRKIFSKDAGIMWKRNKLREADRQINRLWVDD